MLTTTKEQSRLFGTRSSGNKQVDEMMATNFTTVMIPVIKILEYYIDGLEIQIPSREDMITMHKDIELYLGEWREHIKFDINLSLSEHKDLILDLEKLSKYIYAKTKPSEVVDNLFINKKIGLLINPLQRAEEERKPINKPDYNGIASLIKTKTTPKGRF
jgi:hypothetical protein